MSAKNQSESTAAAQEEMTRNARDEAAEVSPLVAPAEETSAATDEAAAQGGEPRPEEAESASEIKITDRRRFAPSVNGAADPPEETAAETPDETEAGATFSDAFEIDLDQMQLEAQAAERELEEMRVKLKESEARREEAVKASEEYADRFRKAQLQLRAETEEMRARMQRTFEQRLELARGDVVAGLLDTLDNLQRAVAAADVATESGPAFEALRDGVRATAEMFENHLKKMGLQAVACEGEPFNPEVHDAVELAVVAPDQDNLVLAELQRGYKFGDRLLRPARVKVGRAE
jgi:molecular chaperone GrpE (heat shock protein)